MSGVVSAVSSYKISAASSLAIANCWKARASSGSGVTVTVAPTSGNLLVVCVGEYGSTADDSSISDDIDGSTGWTKVVRVARTNYSCVVWYKKNIPSGITAVTFTKSTSSSYYTAIVHEVSGASTSSPFTTGESSSNNGTSTTNPTSGSATTATSNSILFACVSNADPSATSLYTANGTGSTPSSGWAYFNSNSYEVNAVSWEPIAVPSVIVSSTGTYAHGWTTNNYQFAAAIAAFH